MVLKNEMSNNTRTTELNRIKLEERERQEAKINLQLQKVELRNDFDKDSNVNQILKEYDIQITDHQTFGEHIQTQMGGPHVYHQYRNSPNVASFCYGNDRGPKNMAEQ